MFTACREAWTPDVHDQDLHALQIDLDALSARLRLHHLISTLRDDDTPSLTSLIPLLHHLHNLHHQRRHLDSPRTPPYSPSDSAFGIIAFSASQLDLSHTITSILALHPTAPLSPALLHLATPAHRTTLTRHLARAHASYAPASAAQALEAYKLAWTVRLPGRGGPGDEHPAAALAQATGLRILHHVRDPACGGIEDLAFIEDLRRVWLQPPVWPGEFVLGGAGEEGGREGWVW